ncbi:MAG: CPBP family intramembrane metalloprotease, partial [Candidatus Caldarchaeum sp.]|nr:CPBP family intramembrane metalloprotease [Candidatus Caldarchaeum sp.]
GLAFLVDVVVFVGGGLTDSFVGLVWGFVRMYTPAAAAAFAGYRWYRIRRNVTGVLVATYLMSPLLAFAALLLYAVFLYVTGFFQPNLLLQLFKSLPIPLDPVLITVLLVVNSYVAALTINAVFAFGEEVGWRGFLQEWFEARGIGFIKSSLLVGVVWGLWHSSAIVLFGYNYPENRLMGVFLFTAFTTSVSIPHAMVKKLSSSVLPAASLHGAINAVWATSLLITSLPRELAGLGPIAFSTWAIVSVAFYAVTLLMRKFRWEANPTQSS